MENNTMLPMAKEDTPQYKAKAMGMNALTTTDLLYLVIQGSGIKAMQSVRSLFDKAKNNINELAKLTVRDFTSIEGIGDAKAMSIIAAIELAKRKNMALPLNRPLVQSSADISRYLREFIGNEDVEKFVVIFLNRANKIMHREVISQGGDNGNCCRSTCNNEVGFRTSGG